MSNPVLNSFAGINNDTDLMARLDGVHVLRFLQKLGFWIPSRNLEQGRQRPFRHDFSNMTGAQLADESGFWQSELSRAHSLLGALRSMKIGEEQSHRRAVARAQLNIWERKDEDGKTAKLTQAQVNAHVMCDTSVIEAENRLRSVEAFCAYFESVIDALDGYTRALSREQSRRSDEMRSGLR